MKEKMKEAVLLGKRGGTKRWKGRSKEDRVEHAKMMVKAREIKRSRKESDYQRIQK